jgi:hypothetical protein
VRNVLLWANDARAVLPPFSRECVTEQMTVPELFARLEHGIEGGDDHHIVRAAKWLLTQVVAVDPTASFSIRERNNAFAARQALREHGEVLRTKILDALRAGTLKSQPAAKRPVPKSPGTPVAAA